MVLMQNQLLRRTILCQSINQIMMCSTVPRLERSNFSGICVNSGDTWAVVPELSHEIMSQEQGLYMYYYSSDDSDELPSLSG